MHKVQMQYLVSLLERYENQRVPIFALQWLTELAHDWLNQVSLGQELVKLWGRAEISLICLCGLWTATLIIDDN